MHIGVAIIAAALVVDPSNLHPRMGWVQPLILTTGRILAPAAGVFQSIPSPLLSRLGRSITGHIDHDWLLLVLMASLVLHVALVIVNQHTQHAPPIMTLKDNPPHLFIINGHTLL